MPTSCSAAPHQASALYEHEHSQPAFHGAACLACILAKIAAGFGQSAAVPRVMHCRPFLEAGAPLTGPW